MNDVLDPEFHMDAVICGCHDKRVKTIPPCYRCRNQVKDEQCWLCYKRGAATPTNQRRWR